MLVTVVSTMAPRPFRFATIKEQSPIGISWARQILPDQVLLEATMVNAAVHLDNLHRREPSPISLSHRGKTIRLVNEMLNSPETAACDSVIGAVTFMAWSGVRGKPQILSVWNTNRDRDLQNFNGDQAETSIHMNALVLLVRMRGGLEHLGFGGILQMLISRYLTPEPDGHFAARLTHI